MTAGGDFIPSGDGNELEPSYPKLFGLTLTPTVSGILIALLGLGGAIWLWFNFVQSKLVENQQLNQEIQDKEQQIANQADTQRQIADARERLQEARQLNADVLSLFATDRSLDTLLLDVNERVQSANAGVQNPDLRANLSQFDLNDERSGVITDSSYGSALNNKLEQRVYDVEVEGSFPQTVSIIRSIERLQPLLVVSDLNSTLDTSTQEIVLDAQGRIVPGGQPETRITTSFQLSAIVPVQSTSPSALEGASPTPSPSP
ncbi:MAG: pilus assembly protein PilO [Cyanobacteria bacterium CRU_2_1]|nr:pilus assembly protein PilO [Cyanobacteria bacterium RU_5_0]NJR58938.1 pilus assembly protein PilO [Cyanobacteria bacterium CRU_2_1]